MVRAQKCVSNVLAFRWESKKRAVDSVFLGRSKDWRRERYSLPCNGHSSKTVGQKKLIPKLGEHHIFPWEIRMQINNNLASYTPCFHLYQSYRILFWQIWSQMLKVIGNRYWKANHIYLIICIWKWLEKMKALISKSDNFCQFVVLIYKHYLGWSEFFVI